MTRLFFALAVALVLLAAGPAAADPTYDDLAARVGRGEPVAVDELRRAQQRDLERLREEYRKKAQVSGGQTPEMKAEYDRRVKEIQSRYNRIDGRNRRVGEMLERAGAQNTGSATKDVRADIDTGSPDATANRRMVEEMRAAGHDVDTSNPHKVIDRTDDHTHWLAETEAGKAAKAKDTDAYRTTGGREAVGNVGEVRDAYGEQLDHRGKFEHARADGDLKTQGKTLAKATESAAPKVWDPNAKTKVDVWEPDPATGKLTKKTIEKPGGFVRDKGTFLDGVGPEARTAYDRSKALQGYGDKVQAGITSLEDAPDVERAKVSEFQKDAAKVMDAAEAKGKRGGEIRDRVRENFADSHRRAGTTSDAVRHDPDADFRNRADGIEADRARVRGDNAAAESYVAGEKTKATAKDTYTGGWKDPEARGGAHGGHEAKPAAADADSSKTAARRPGVGEQIVGGVQTGGMVVDAATRRAGQAIDENRDLDAGDLAAVGAEVTGAEAIYGAARRRSAEEQAKVEAGEQGQLEALGRTAVGLGKDVIVDPVNQAVENAIREEEARAAAAGEEPDYVRSSANAAAEIGGTLTGTKAVADAWAETGTWQERADWAAQRDAVAQKVGDEARWRDKRIRTLGGELERIALDGDPNDPATRATIEQKLADLRAEEDRLRRATEMAERTLGEEDPDAVASVRRARDAAPRAEDIEDYVNQLLRDRAGAASAGPAAGSVAEPLDPEVAAVLEAESGEDAPWAAGESGPDRAEAVPEGDDDLDRLLDEALAENERAVAESAGRAGERTREENERIASIGSRTSAAAETWSPGPETSLDDFRDAVVRDRIRRGDPLPGEEPVAARGGGSAAPTGSGAAGSGPGGGGGSAVPPSASRRGGIDRESCMRACVGNAERATRGADNRTEFLAQVRRQCDWQCGEVASGRAAADPVRNCVEAALRGDPAAARNRARVEASCRATLGRAPVPPRPAPSSPARSGSVPSSGPSSMPVCGLLGQGDC